MTQGPEPNTGEPQSLSSAPADGSFQLGNVMKVAVPVGALLIAAVIFFGVFDGTRMIAKATAPRLVKVTGQVFFNGEPFAHAEIATQPVKPGFRGAIGTTDEQGQFSLMTHVDGEFVTGTYPGEYKVTVARRHNVTTLGLPPLETPQEYSEFSTSPFRLVAAEGAHVEFKLEGELTERPASGPPMVQTPPGERAGGGGAKKKSRP